MHRLPFNTDRTIMKLVLVSTIVMRDPFMRLKRKKLCPTMNPKEVQRAKALAWAAEAEEGDKEEEETPSSGREGRQLPQEEEAGRTKLYVNS